MIEMFLRIRLPSSCMFEFNKETQAIDRIELCPHPRLRRSLLTSKQNEENLRSRIFIHHRSTECDAQVHPSKSCTIRSQSGNMSGCSSTNKVDLLHSSNAERLDLRFNLNFKLFSHSFGYRIVFVDDNVVLDADFIQQFHRN